MAEHGDDPTSTDEPRRRSRWLAAAALVGAAGPTAVVPAGAASAATGAQVPAAAPTVAHAAAAAGDGDPVVVVRRGDTVSGIAVRTGSTVAAITEANGLGPQARIVEGQRLRVPAPTAASSSAAAEHTVVAGETLTSIAAQHGTTVAALREANGLDARGFIRAGQVLKVGGGASTGTTTGTTASDTYTVRAGDTLSHIAAATGTTVATLVELNGLDRTGFIVEGQELRLAQRPTATPAAPPASEQAGSLAAAVEANRARLAQADIPSRDEMREIIRSTAVRLGVDPSLALAIGYQESGFNMGVVSHANAIGAMQVIPTSGEWASDLLGEEIDLFDARDNAKAGVAILRTLVASNPPDIAIASYYQGQASVRSRGMYDDTRRYVANVQTLQARFR
ncbi:lytic transglycosylase [Kineococcus auxinigenes]|uniref:lytic transglycosylase n=1 Tax=unclassified Kineococcus TaxID=2621656 RepID=UPI003D7E9562